MEYWLERENEREKSSQILIWQYALQSQTKWLLQFLLQSKDSIQEKKLLETSYT